MVGHTGFSSKTDSFKIFFDNQNATCKFRMTVDLGLTETEVWVCAYVFDKEKDHA